MKLWPFSKKASSALDNTFELPDGVRLATDEAMDDEHMPAPSFSSPTPHAPVMGEKPEAAPSAGDRPKMASAWSNVWTPPGAQAPSTPQATTSAPASPHVDAFSLDTLFPDTAPAMPEAEAVFETSAPAFEEPVAMASFEPAPAFEMPAEAAPAFETAPAAGKTLDLAPSTPAWLMGDDDALAPPAMETPLPPAQDLFDAVSHESAQPFDAAPMHTDFFTTSAPPEDLLSAIAPEANHETGPVYDIMNAFEDAPSAMNTMDAEPAADAGFYAITPDAAFYAPPSADNTFYPQAPDAMEAPMAWEMGGEAMPVTDEMPEEAALETACGWDDEYDAAVDVDAPVLTLDASHHVSPLDAIAELQASGCWQEDAAATEPDQPVMEAPQWNGYTPAEPAWANDLEASEPAWGMLEAPETSMQWPAQPETAAYETNDMSESDMAVAWEKAQAYEAQWSETPAVEPPTEEAWGVACETPAEPDTPAHWMPEAAAHESWQPMPEAFSPPEETHWQADSEFCASSEATDWHPAAEMPEIPAATEWQPAMTEEVAAMEPAEWPAEPPYEAVAESVETPMALADQAEMASATPEAVAPEAPALKAVEPAACEAQQAETQRAEKPSVALEALAYGDVVTINDYSYPKTLRPAEQPRKAAGAGFQRTVGPDTFNLPVREPQFNAVRKTRREHSIADELHDLEQEVILNESRFMKKSIDDLVSRYFSQSSEDDHWQAG